VSDPLLGVTLTRGLDNTGNDDNTLDVGETWVYTGSYTVTQSDMDTNGGGDGDIDNTASVSSTEIPTPQTDSEAATLNNQPAYTITKDADVTSVSTAGDVITYTIVISNTGNSLLTGVGVSDPLLADLDCDGAIGYQTTNLSIAVDSSLTCTGSYAVTASDISTNGGGDGDIDNTASVSSTEIPTPQTDSEEVAIEPADLSLNKTVDNSSPVVGENVTYTITVTNNGTADATGVTVTDVLPAGLTYVSDDSASTTTTYNNGTGVWDIGGLNSGNSISLQIIVTVDQAGAITNTAEVSSSDQFDPNSTPNNNEPSENDQASVTIGGIFDPPSALKTFNDSGLPELEFRMVWMNSGNDAAIDVQVTDEIPAGTTYVTGSITCEPRGSSSTAGAATAPLSLTAIPGSSCGFDSVNNRVQWQGNIGPDDGNLTEAAADNEVVITFRVTVNDGVNQVLNRGFARTDLNDDDLFDEPSVPGTSLVSSNQTVWNRNTDVETPRETELPYLLPVTGFAPGVVSVLPEQPASKAYSATDVWLEIPNLGVQMPIVGVPLVDGDWNVSWLGNQAGWLEGTAFPSWKGNSAVTGHVTLANGLSGPFANLGNLKWGDKIVVHAYGYVYTYQVRENKVIAPNDTSVLRHETDSWLTLITCKNYNETTNSYANRISVRAVLISVQMEKAIPIPFGVR
jgi:LPXTG-site transpeptidase (sortase) family protein